jgi:Xaa-Pro dipeptidase
VAYPPLTEQALTAAEFAERLHRTRREMAARGLAALLVVSPENVYYLAGLNHLGYFAFTLLVVPRDGRPRLVTRAMERRTVAAQAPDCVHVAFADDEDPAQAARRAVREVTTPGDRVGLERTSMFLPVAVWESTRSSLDDLEWADASGLVDGLRAAKSATEVGFVRRAAEISDRAMQAGIAAVRSGVNEREVAAAVYAEMVLAGSEQPGIPPLIRSADLLRQEHVTWRDHVVDPGESLLFELSASVARYHAPLSRMVYLGRPPSGTPAAAEIALAGEQAVLDSLRPGAVAAAAVGATIGRRRGAVPPRVLVVACEPERIVRGEHDEDLVGELSPPVRAAVEEAVPVVESLVAELAAELQSTRKE